MKTIRKNFLLLAFAFGALFLIGNNVLADHTVIEDEEENASGWVNCRYHDGSGSFPFFWRDCSTCSSALFSSGNRGQCYK
jgi:hypothetical protein